MTSNPDTSLTPPAQAQAPLSQEDAARLLAAIRQTEDQAAETETAAPAADSAAPVRGESGSAAAEPISEGAEDAAAEAVSPDVDAAELLAAEDVVAEAVSIGSANSDADPAAAESDSAEAAGVERVDFAFVSGTVEEAVAEATGSSNVIIPGDVASDVETIVHVMRHGEVHNPKGILYGRLPGFQLSVTGRSQAAAVARSLADHDIALVVASPLQRAQETAEPVAGQHGLVIRTDDNLIEAGNTFEGLRVSVGDGALRKPRHWWKLRDPFTPSWGEPYLQIAHRMLAAVNKARVEAAGREAVLVSHQLPVWTLRRFLQGQRLWHDPRQRQCSLASLTSLVYQGDTLIDIVYSEPAGATDPMVTGA